LFQFENSDSEDDDDDVLKNLEPIYESRNVYHIRRLPHVVGTQLFLVRWFGSYHRCTVVGNPGMGSMGFWANSIEGILWVVINSRGSPFFVFYCILLTLQFLVIGFGLYVTLDFMKSRGQGWD
jgi:hypothetical protein